MSRTERVGCSTKRRNLRKDNGGTTALAMLGGGPGARTRCLKYFFQRETLACFAPVCFWSTAAQIRCVRCRIFISTIPD